MSSGRSELVMVNGEAVPWSEARIDLWSDAVLRASSVFEGMCAYKAENGDYRILAVDAHYERLRISAELLRIASAPTAEEFAAACLSACNLWDLGAITGDLYLRPTLCGLDADRSIFFAPAFHRSEPAPLSISLQTTSWRRANEDQLPTRAKAAANYQPGRLARMEAERAGADEALMLNSAGRVAETAGSNVVAFFGDRIVTPPPAEGALSGITVGLLEILARPLGLRFEREPLTRSDLVAADAVALVGTLHEVVPVVSIDGIGSSLRSDRCLQLRDAFAGACRGGEGHDLLPWTSVPVSVAVD